MKSWIFRLFDRFDWYHKKYCDVKKDLTWSRSMKADETANICSRHYIEILNLPRKVYKDQK